jgi:hypothetical protein
MTGPEGAMVFMAGITLVCAVVVLLDWWGRRRDRSSQRPHVR